MGLGCPTIAPGRNPTIAAADRSRQGSPISSGNRIRISVPPPMPQP